MTKNITNELRIEQTQTLRTQYDETNHVGSKNKISDQHKRKSVKRQKCPPCGRLKSLALEPQLSWCWAATTSGLVPWLLLVLERASMSSLGTTLSGGSGGAGDVLINSPLAEKMRLCRVALLLLLLVVELLKQVWCHPLKL